MKTIKKGSILPMCVYYKGVPMTFVDSLINSYKALNNLMPLQSESSAMINRARTINGKEFLKSRAEWALLVDTDMWWEPNAIIRMVKTAKEKDAKMVAGLAFMEQAGRIVPNAYRRIPVDGKTILAPFAVLPALNQAFPVDATGGSCLLVHRDVYQDVFEASVERGDTAHYWQEDVFEGGTEMTGEDLIFCKRAKALGYEIWYEPRSLFSHLSKDTLLDVREYVEFLERSNLEYAHLRHEPGNV